MTQDEVAQQQNMSPAGSEPTQSGGAPALGGVSALGTASIPQLTDEHIQPIAKAMQVAHGFDMSNILAAAPQYENDAKAFLAAFNMALQIIDSLRANWNSPPPPPNQPQPVR